MSDEIDIEEHDVLDNPTLKRIFPDLTIIKKEISQYEEGLGTSLEGIEQEELDDAGETVSEPKSMVHQIVDVAPKAHVKSRTQVNRRLEVHRRFKTFLDSLADDFFDNIDVNSDTISSSSSPTLSDDNPSTSSHLNWSESLEAPVKDIKRLHNGVFILGSKPSKRQPCKSVGTKKQLKIVLKNVSPYLSQCKRYCKHCSILFPNINALSFHMSKYHCNQTGNSVIKNKSELGLKSPQTKFQCSICTISLSSKSNLVRHFKMVHKKNEIKKSGHMSLETRRSLRGSLTVNSKIQKLKRDIKSRDTKASFIAEKSDLNTNHNCFHCPKVFKNRSSLIEHLYNVIKPLKTGSNSSPKSKQITKSQESKIDKHNMDGENSNMFETVECSACAIKFSSKAKLNQHNRVSHLNKKAIANNKKNYSKRNAVHKSHHVLEISNESSIKSMQSNANLKDDSFDITKEQRNDEENKYSNSDVSNDIISDNNSSGNFESDSEQKSNTKNPGNRNNLKEKQVFQCFICSQYMTYLKWYSRHMASHSVKEVTSVDKTIFESQCKFCYLKFSTIKLYNCHVLKSHQEKVTKKIKLVEKAFSSSLFKCFECDVFFLSVKTAQSHSEHEEIFLNWKCLDCRRLFKMKDKPLHLKQHALCKNINAYALSESSLNRVLYKCLKCAIHFSENEYFLHLTTCDLEIPNSAYCNPCDILINRNDMILHERAHKVQRLQAFDFTFIESDIIINNVKKQIVAKKNPHAASKFALTFCHFCKCFVGNVGGRHKSHIKGLCSKWVTPRLCRKCGLVFTPRGFISHRMLHDKVESLNLQTFYYYDIKSKKVIRPPIPKYPHCNICQVHFLGKKAVKEHDCKLIESCITRCYICQIKLTDAAYKLHQNFHNYKVSTSVVKNKLNTVLDNKESITSSSICGSSELVKRVSPENQTSNITGDSVEQKPVFLYSCVSCYITLYTYDSVVQHCHDHYDYYKELQSSDPTEKYSIGKNGDKIFVTLKFDPFYFRFNNEIWIKHIFEGISKDDIKNILEHSIYKFECRLKMEEIQSGSSNVVLYKCSICRAYIDPNDLYSHVGNTCTTNRKHPCSVCGLCFHSSQYRIVHEKVHERTDINISSYKIMLFNKTEHQLFTKMMLDSCTKFVFYQCRNCEDTVDKLQREIHRCRNAELLKCSCCGLLFYGQEFILHDDKHKTIINFKPEHMIIIKFGKFGAAVDNNLKSSFNGTVYDLTFYKCTSCGLCLMSKTNMSDHVCVPKTSKSQCPKCYLCFLKKDIDEHIKLHDNLELRYDDFNSNVIIFDLSTKNVSTDNGMELAHDSLIQNEIIEKQNDTNVTSNMQKIYKCSCGLHFLEDLNARKHFSNCNPKIKMSKQTCFKCDLLFTPAELFNHLLKHHGDKKVQYKYDIINVHEE